MKGTRAFDDALAVPRKALMSHPLYARLADERSVVRFMERHVFAVWDFMSLVKSLQRSLTCVEVPWLPVGDPVERRFINEIVLDEESDLDAEGRPRSHFELYLDAMRAAGAETGTIDLFLETLRETGDPVGSLHGCGACPSVQLFVETTLDLAGGEALETAAAFAYGRELLIPPIFREVVAKLGEREPERFGPLGFYLSRHIETDETNHGPIARRLVERLIGGDAEREARALRAAWRALEARCALWDATAFALAED